MSYAWGRWFESFRDLLGGRKAPRGKCNRGGRRLSLEILEDRRVPSAVPTVSLSAPAQAFIGETAPVSLTFSNTGTQPGFSPWAYVVLHSTGADGNDGISFVSGSASYLGAAVTTVVSNFDGSGDVTGPSFARAPATDQPIVLTGGTPNDQVVFFQLPFGSFAVGQPDATIQLHNFDQQPGRRERAVELAGARRLRAGQYGSRRPDH